MASDDRPTGWQPIHTAPMLELVFAWNGERRGIGHPSRIITRWIWSDGQPISPPPTHWMPLPEPPQ